MYVKDRESNKSNQREMVVYCRPAQCKQCYTLAQNELLRLIDFQLDFTHEYC